MKLTSLLLVFSTLLFFSCSSSHLVSTTDGKKIDKRLLGKWGGSEEDQQIAGLKKEWVMTRENDGTFQLDFKMTYNGETENTTEIGKWWVSNGKFYEYHEDSEKTDTYKYTVLSNDQIQFDAIDIGVDVDNEKYTFTDTRIKEGI